jgi:hypothetical protein
VASARWVQRLVALGGGQATETLRALGLPAIAGDPGATTAIDARAAAATRRALLLDLRNLGTLGLQQDSFPGLLWADAIYGRGQLSAAAMAAIPRMYAAAEVRRALDPGFQRPGGDPARIARGRVLFTERVAGTIANRQILKRAPRAYAAAALDGPVLAPLDPTKPQAKLAVSAPTATRAPSIIRWSRARRPAARPLRPLPPDHTRLDSAGDRRRLDRSDDPPVAALPTGRSPAAEVATCEGCHAKPALRPARLLVGPLFPLDANSDGGTQLGQAADQRPAASAPIPGSPSTCRAGSGRSRSTSTVTTPPAPVRRPGARRRLVVRAAPLVGLGGALPAQRLGSDAARAARAGGSPPKTFPLGRAGFILDTACPAAAARPRIRDYFTPAEKDDLVAFLESL